MSHKKPGKVLFQGMESGMTLFRVAVLVLVVIFWLSGIQTVGTTEVGVLTRFGRIVPNRANEKIRPSGFVPAMPKPIDELIRVPGKDQLQQLQITDVWRSLEDPIQNNKIDPLVEGYCITGDQNIIQTSITVKYYIRDAQAYHFGLENPDDLIEDLVLASLTQSVSGWNVDEVLQMQRTYEVARQADSATAAQAEEMVAVTEKLGDLVAGRAQKRLDALQSGVILNQIEFQHMHYPRHVNKEFVNVQTARIAAETERHAAEGDADRMKENAKTLADNEITWAQNYRQNVLARAGAQQREFEPLYLEYTRSPELVWQRIYMNTIQEIMGKVGAVDFVPGNTRVILPSSEDRK